MVKRAAVKAVSLIWLGSLTGAACAFLTQVLLARQLGPADFGTFSAALASVTLVAPLAAFGVPAFWLKVFGEEGWQARRWIPASFLCVLLTIGLVACGLLIWAELGPNDPRTKQLLMVLTACVFGQATLDLVSARYQLEEHYRQLAGWQLLQHFLRLVVVVGLMAGAVWSFDVTTIATGYAAVACLMLATGLPALVSFGRGIIALKGHGEPARDTVKTLPLISGCKSVFAQSWPFGLANVFHIIYYQSDVVLLKYLASPSEAGIYNVAFVIMSAVYLLPGIFYQKFMLSKLHRWASHDEAMFYRSYRTGNRIMLIVGLCVMAALWIVTIPAINLLFGPSYRASIPLIMLLALCVPLRFVSANLGAALTTREHMKRRLSFMGITAAANVALNLMLIPLLGSFGAAISTIACEILLLILFFTYAERKFAPLRNPGV